MIYYDMICNKMKCNDTIRYDTICIERIQRDSILAKQARFSIFQRQGTVRIARFIKEEHQQPQDQRNRFSQLQTVKFTKSSVLGPDHGNQHINLKNNTKWSIFTMPKCEFAVVKVFCRFISVEQF